MTTISDDQLYTGLHAFVFIKEVDPGRNIADVVDDIADPERFSSDNGRVLFASVVSGRTSGSPTSAPRTATWRRCSGSSTTTCGPGGCAASMPWRAPSTPPGA